MKLCFLQLPAMYPQVWFLEMQERLRPVQERFPQVSARFPKMQELILVVQEQQKPVQFLSIQEQQKPWPEP